MDVKEARNKIKTLRTAIMDKASHLFVGEKEFPENSYYLPIGTEWSEAFQDIHIKEIETSFENTTVSLINAKAGAKIHAHYHNEYEVTFVCWGRIRENVSGAEYREHETCRIQAGETHSFEALEDSLLIVQWVPKLPQFKPDTD